MICTAVKHLIADVIEDIMFMFDPADAAADLWNHPMCKGDPMCERQAKGDCPAAVDGFCIRMPDETITVTTRCYG